MKLDVLLALLVIAGTLLGLMVGAFLLACRLAGLPQPRFILAVAVVMATAFVWSIIEAIFVGALYRVYEFAGFPNWELALVGLFAGLPVSLAVGTVLHMAFLKVNLSQAIQVWFIERLIRFGFVLACTGGFVLIWLSRK